MSAVEGSQEVTLQQQEMIKYLDQLYRHIEAYGTDDDPVTTFCSAGAVLVTSILAGTEDPDQIAGITRLPESFCDLVLTWATLNSLHSDANWPLLVEELGRVPAKFDVLEGDICGMVEELFLRQPITGMDWALESAREGRLLGGATQWWIDTENRTPEPPQWLSDLVTQAA